MLRNNEASSSSSCSVYVLRGIFIEYHIPPIGRNPFGVHEVLRHVVESSALDPFTHDTNIVRGGSSVTAMPSAASFRAYRSDVAGASISVGTAMPAKGAVVPARNGFAALASC